MLVQSEIVEAFRVGAAVPYVFDRLADRDETAIVAGTLADLHNSRRIDVFSIVSSDDFENLQPWQFFGGQHLLCEMIPMLVSPVDPMMHFVAALVRRGGNDLAANGPNAAFRAWCANDLRRSREIIDQAAHGDSLAMDHLVFALTAGAAARDAERFALDFDGQRRWSAVTALGQIKPADRAARLRALSVMTNVLQKDGADITKANILSAALNVVDRGPAIAERHWIGVIQLACANAGDQTLYQAAQALWVHKAIVGANVVKVLLDALSNLSSDHQGTIDQLDLGLAAHLERNQELALNFVRKLLVKNAGKIPLQKFDAFTRQLVSTGGMVFSRTLIDWLLAGQRDLCEGLKEAIAAKLGDKAILTLDFAASKLEDVQALFVCRKAVGYFFFAPVTAASILVCALRTAGPQLTASISALLFDPLLINYGGDVKQYLLGLEPDAATEAVGTVLRQREGYLEGLRSTGEIPELRPSERRRQIESTRWHGLMRESMGKAESRSVLMDLVSRSTILYGRKSVTHVQGPDDELRRVEIELKEHSLTFELPRMQAIDPHGLDYVLRVFRSEQLIQ